MLPTHPEALGMVSYATWKDTTHSAEQQWKKNVRVLDLLVRDTAGVLTPVKLNQRNIFDRDLPVDVFSLYLHVGENAGHSVWVQRFCRRRRWAEGFLVCWTCS